MLIPWRTTANAAFVRAWSSSSKVAAHWTGSMVYKSALSEFGLEALQRNSAFRSAKSDLTIVKTLLNNLWTHIGHEDDGHLVHTDKRTGKQKISIKTWRSLVSAREALAVGLSKIEWEELNEPPPAA
jgi:hypothetical protein